MSFQPIQVRTDNTKSINSGQDGKGLTIGKGSVNCKSVYPLWQSMGCAQETKTELSYVATTVALGVHSTDRGQLPAEQVPSYDTFSP